MTRRDWLLATIVPALIGVCVVIVWQRPFERRAPQPSPPAAPAPTAPDYVIDAQPKPEHSPQQVVRIVVDALRFNDAPTADAGIATTFRFASPNNRAVTGPLERFTAMIKTPAYIPMLIATGVRFGEMKIENDRAEQYVQLQMPDGSRLTYHFMLSKQSDAPYADCWMTDGVRFVPRDQAPVIERDDKPVI
jgi:hypothetical protein